MGEFAGFRVSSPFRALRSRNYRLFFIGQGISLIGSWMTRLATAWLVYRLTDSEFLLGLVSFASQAPSLFLPPLAGVWLDRWDRHKVLVVAQVLSMLQSLAMAALTLSGHVNMPWIIGLALFQGVVSAVEIPTRQAFVVRMIDDRADLGNAIALNSSNFNSARLIGPAIAGGLVGGGWRRLLLPHRRPQLHRRDLGTAVDAPAAGRPSAGGTKRLASS